MITNIPRKVFIVKVLMGIYCKEKYPLLAISNENYYGSQTHFRLPKMLFEINNLIIYNLNSFIFE